MIMHEPLRTGTIWSSIKRCWAYNTHEIERILPAEYNLISAERWPLQKTMKIREVVIIILEWFYLNFLKEADKNSSEWKPIQYATKFLIARYFYAVVFPQPFIYLASVISELIL